MKRDVVRLDDEIRALASERRLPAICLERWLKLDNVSRAKFFELARNLKMRTGQIVASLEGLEEIALRERSNVGAILDRDEIKRSASGAGAAMGAGAGPARASAVLEAVRALRFPQLRKMQNRLRDEIAAIELPRGIKVDLPRELGSDELTVSIKARSGKELGRLVEKIGEKKAALARIVEMLGGRDD